MGVRVQVSLGEEIINLADHYAELMGVTRSALCSLLISNGLLEYKEKFGVLKDVPSEKTTPRICERLQMLFDGWIAQFENMPNWKPQITFYEDFVCVDGQKLFPMETVVDGVQIDGESIQILYYESQNDEVLKEALIYIDWPLNSVPVISIENIENHTGAFTNRYQT